MSIGRRILQNRIPHSCHSALARFGQISIQKLLGEAVGADVAASLIGREPLVGVDFTIGRQQACVGNEGCEVAHQSVGWFEETGSVVDDTADGEVGLFLDFAFDRLFKRLATVHVARHQNKMWSSVLCSSMTTMLTATLYIGKR